MNLFSQPASRNFMLRKDFRMSPAAALSAAEPENQTATEIHRERCMMLHALNAGVQQRSISSRETIVPFTVKLALMQEDN